MSKAIGGFFPYHQRTGDSMEACRAEPYYSLTYAVLFDGKDFYNNVYNAIFVPPYRRVGDILTASDAMCRYFDMTKSEFLNTNIVEVSLSLVQNLYMCVELSDSCFCIVYNSWCTVMNCWTLLPLLS